MSELARLAKVLGRCVASRSAQGWEETAAYEQLRKNFPDWEELVRKLEPDDWAAIRKADLEDLLRSKRLLSENLSRAQRRGTELLEETRTLRRERNVAAGVSEQGTWVWSDSDDNHLDSLVEDAVVTMTAGQLRALLRG